MYELKIESIRDEVDNISMLIEETAVSITLHDKQDSPILEPEIGTTPLWPTVIISALYSSKKEAEIAYLTLSTHYPKQPALIEELLDKDWEKEWMSHYTPLKFGERLWVCPSWVTPPEPLAINLILNPGLAFGTGTHPTTSLCLEWLEKADLSKQTLIDYGCGSGILAVAALMLGCDKVHAVDIDSQALIATENNAQLNHINPSNLIITKPEKLSEKYHLLIANILLNPLKKLVYEFHEHILPSGKLIVSGILQEQSQELIDIYKDTFIHKATHVRDEWALLEFESRKTAKTYD